MKIINSIFIIIVISASLLCCSSLEKDIAYIEKDLGIKFPQEFYILNKQKDFLGFEESWNYEFSFEKEAFDSLVIELKNSFNFNAQDTFTHLSHEQQLILLNELAENGRIGWWIKNDQGYKFIPFEYYNSPVFEKVKKPLKNRNPENVHNVIYSIEAEIDTVNRVLSYKYMQL